MSTSLGGSRGPSGSLSGTATGNIIPKGYKQGQLQQFSPEQMQLFQSLFSQVSPDSYLSKLAGGDQSSFEQMEAPAMRQFQELQGQNASRFSGMGMGARRGSGFQNVQNQATSDFSQDLMSRRQGLQRQALMDLMGISESLLGQRPTEQFLTPKKKSFWEELLSGMSGGIGQGLGTAGSMYGMNKFGLMG